MDHKKSEDLLYIDKCFMSIKNKVGVNENLNKISLALKRLYDIKFNFNIVNNTTNTFFGMTIYPSISTMDLMVESIMNRNSTMSDITKLWAENKEWNVEIDSILLYDMNLNASPSEMTAVLLHEIGHVVNSNAIPQRIYKILKFKILKLNYQIKQLVSTDKIRKIFNITIAESCEIKNYNYIDTKAESDADIFVVHNGYGEELNHFIDKMIKSQGNGLVNRTENEMDSEIKTVVNWTILNVKELEFRKKSLRKALKIEMIKTPSELTKKIIQDIYNTIFGEATDRYRMLLSEQSGFTNTNDIVAEMESDQILDKFIHRVLTEASNNIFDKNGKLKKITQNDIDILHVESERIENVDDKIYLLDKLYSQLELIDMGLDYIESNEKDMSSKVTQSKKTLLDMKEQLEELRKQILATKIIDKQYGVYLKMPKGFEG